MKFRTELDLKSSEFKISHSNQIMGIGSCFVNEIGEKLNESKFKTMINPFGTLFHPLAIGNALARIHSLTYYTRDEIFNYGESFFSWDHHSSFNRSTADETLDNINYLLEKANEFIRNTNCFILTFGTAWIYRIKDSGLFTANCHKVPAHVFEKSLMSEKQVVSSIKHCVNLIQDINPSATIFATVSPVRHIKDGIVENSVSKARLISGLNQVVSQTQNLIYFPAYEFLNDDLRDYRFYAADLVHPNEIAVDYIWEKFSKVFFDTETIQKIEQLAKVKSALEHRPMNPKSVAYKEFLYKTGKLIENIEKQFPKNSFDDEKLKLQKLNELC